VEVDRVHEVLACSGSPAPCTSPIGTLALMDSLAAFVIRCRRYVMMFSNRRLRSALPDHRCSRLPHCPVVPPAEVFPRRTFVDVAV